MEEEAIITAVQAGPKTTINESLELEFLHVSFRVLRRFKYQDKLCRAAFKSPSWLSDLQTSAPLDGYLMEHGEFSASLPKDGRITEGVKVIVEVADSLAAPSVAIVGRDDLKPQEPGATELARIAAEAEKKEPEPKDWHTFKTP